MLTKPDVIRNRAIAEMYQQCRWLNKNEMGRSRITKFLTTIENLDITMDGILDA